MQNREKVRYVFTSSNTRRGFHTFIPQLLCGLHRLYVLEGPLGSGQGVFIRQLGEDVLERGLCAEFWISASDPLNPEGILIPEMETAVVCSQLIESVAYKEIPLVRFLDIASFMDQSMLTRKTGVIEDLYEQIARCSQTASQHLLDAGRYSDAIKKITAAHINQMKMLEVADDLTTRIFDSPGKEKHYFASAVTAEGMINYIDTLSQACRKRYLFTGPAGSGKSAMIAAIADKARQKDLVVEYYYCGFDADSLTAIIIPNFQVALVDAGFLAVNLQPGDEIIDSQQYLDHYDLQQCGPQMAKWQRQNEKLLQEAQQQLEKAQQKLAELKRIYETAADYKKGAQLREEIIGEITGSLPR